MPKCTDAERRMLDNIKAADAVFILREEDQSTIRWIKGFGQRPPASFTVDYGHIDGERMVRRLKVTMGLTAKQFAAAVERGKARDGAEAKAA